MAWAAVALALCVIVFGSFVRLSDAGLSCPDWPTCYGRAAWPVHAEDVAHANANFERPVESHKAWREQFHRHLAATLGILVLTLALLAARHRRHGVAIVVGAAVLVAVSIPLYMGAYYVAASILAIAAELALIGKAISWNNRDLSRVAALTFAMIIFQALLGMWTVTWLLKPIVVMGHLLGGLTTLSLLLWMAWRMFPSRRWDVSALRLRGMIRVGVVLLAIQIALGGWTSANYAALSCGTDFPTCLGQWWPHTDFREAFVLWRGIGVDYEGGVLDGAARTAIQMSHRIMALLVFGHLLMLAFKLRRVPGLGRWGIALALLLGMQVTLGISNVHFALPLFVAVAHNAGAALLLALLVTLLARMPTDQVDDPS
ncbi:MAG: COX15/CtaA family protein [Lysobacteraceae bacterium]|nr:COX15/CtaA family protein [Xanthomonadaceae bacterium]HRX99247.1 COX15/CtaA family protein [Xanthomonadaceae bacterium]